MGCGFKQLLSVGVFCLSAICPSVAFSRTDLLAVYQQALHSDPVLQNAKALYQEALESLPAAKATLLPQVSIVGTRSYSNSQQVGDSPYLAVNGETQDSNYVAQLTQTLFNFSNITNLSAAKAGTRTAEANYLSAQQSLIQRVTKAYFDVLEAQDQLKYIHAKLLADQETLQQAKQRYRVGLDTQTSVYEAQASFDSSIASEISQKNKVTSAELRLQEISGVLHQHLVSLKPSIPLKVPKPANINAWTEKAVNHNLSVVADRWTTIQDRFLIASANGGHLPSLVLQGSSTRDHSNTPGEYVASTRTNMAALQLTMPILSGGLVNSEVRSAEDQYQADLAALERDTRRANSNIRQDYLEILSLISQLKADKQAIKSHQSALKGAKAELQVGTKTTLDVLQSQQLLLQAQQNDTRDLYIYLNDIIKLKLDAGELNIVDLQHINQWLG